MARFRTRARAVDMLGRQQIAGIPTAISELFKNAHDAYAEVAVADFFRHKHLFVVRDDGIGMSREDFEQRWLMLGTESKVEAQGVGRPPPRPGTKKRPVLGEKGIGRLAIAAIGPQVLVMTRALKGNELGELVVAFINWGVFELVSADLDQVEIPVLQLPGGELPSEEQVGRLIDEVETNLLAIKGRGDAKTVKRIQGELREFRAFSPEALEVSLATPGIREGPGTHFYIKPASPNLSADLEEVKGPPVEAAPLIKTLLGFSNTMTPGHSPPALSTEFRDHWSEEASDDLIRESAFFTPDEFVAADHHFQGSFDEYGQFQGAVSVFGSDPTPWDLAWGAAGGEKTACGPFRINIAYVQGKRQQTRLDPEDWMAIIAKLDRYSGLYIYRDGIRVLPYGNSDVDFLDIERNRSKSASDHFFSYRRMFGVIELTRAANGELREKAGREGFTTNKAYRQFREMLKAFFYKVAFDFFREEGNLSEPYYAQRAEFERLDKARKKRSRQVGGKRRKLSMDLSEFFDRVDRQEPEEKAEELVSRLKAEVETALAKKEPGDAAVALAEGEAEARAAIREFESSYEVRRPTGVGLSRAVAQTLRGYELERERLSAEVFEPLQSKVEEIMGWADDEHKSAVARRVRFERAIEIATRDSVDQATAERQRLTRAAGEATDRSKALGRDGLRAVEEAVQSVRAAAARTDVSSLADAEFVKSRTELEQQATNAALDQIRALSSVAEQLESLVWPENGDGTPLVTQLDEIEAIETELEGFRERADQDLERTQLGMAVEVINHEFQTTVKSIRANIKRLDNWAEANPALQPPVRDLRSSFEHLDGYLTLFTPLNRRLYRKKVKIKGGEIEAFLRDVFHQRLDESKVELKATKRFIAYRVEQYPSTIYPVFVNLVDNALFWLEDFPGKRTITLDVRKGDLLVVDSGPGVANRDRDSIFEMGFTHKPGGSGYGLYISRQVLEREGMTLDLEPPIADGGAIFRIGGSGASK
jgi:signal transduction histidine kinase